VKKNNEIISRKDIIKVLVVIVANWHLLLLLPAIAYVGAYLYTHRIPDVYAAKCQILLKTNETYDYQQQIYKGLGFTSKYASYEETASQMRVIKSANLIEEVLNRLSLNVAYYIVGRLKVSEVYEHMPFRAVMYEKSPLQYGLDFKLKIIDESKFKLSYEFKGEEESGVFKFGELILNDGLYLTIEKQPNLNDASISTLSQINYLFRGFRNESLINRFQSNIDTRNLDYTSIVEITLKDQIPKRAVDVLDTLAKFYVNNTLESKKEINQNTLTYIDRQLNEVVEIINVIEGELERYKQEKSILNLTKEEENYFNRLVELENEQRRLELELKSIEDLTDYLLQNDRIEAFLPPSMFVAESDPQLKIYVSELYKLRAEISNFQKSGTQNNPIVNNLTINIEAKKRDILGYLNGQKMAVNTAYKDLNSNIVNYESRIKSIPKTQRHLLNIERRLLVNEDLYSFLLSKRAETVIAKAGLVPETKIIEKARGIGIVYPDKGQMRMLSMLVGIALAILIVIIRELFFQKITSLGLLQASTSISVLGSIPKKKNFSPTYRILSGSEKSEIVQSFRSLRTNLQYFTPSNGSQRILVTSLLPGEGKTFTTVNLASVLAIAEKKVLIVDFDLHKPRLAKAMEMPNTEGVSSFLIGASKMEDIIQKTSLSSLDVITSGPIPPNASELMLRDEIHDLFKYAEEHYDYVFLDTPPITLITDGVYLMKSVDVKLFVLNSKSTTKTSIDYIERLVEENDIENCALILNEEKLSRVNYYYSKYGYGGYGYGGYGYGYGYQEYGDGAS
jgi:capsular exopolysaccharide synthesis family protein